MRGATIYLQSYRFTGLSVEHFGHPPLPPLPPGARISRCKSSLSRTSTAAPEGLLDMDQQVRVSSGRTQQWIEKYASMDKARDVPVSETSPDSKDSLGGHVFKRSVSSDSGSEKDDEDTVYDADAEHASNTSEEKTRTPSPKFIIPEIVIDHH